MVLILIRLHPDSLLLVSAYGLLDNLVRVVSGAAVGRYVDRWASTACRQHNNKGPEHIVCKFSLGFLQPWHLSRGLALAHNVVTLPSDP